MAEVHLPCALAPLAFDTFFLLNVSAQGFKGCVFGCRSCTHPSVFRLESQDKINQLDFLSASLFLSDNRAAPARPLPVFDQVFDDAGGGNICCVLGQQQKDLLRVGLLLQQDPQERVRMQIYIQILSWFFCLFMQTTTNADVQIIFQT